MANWRKVDLLSASALAAETAAFRPTHVIHLAARTDLCESEGLDYYAANTHGVINLLSALQHLPELKRSIFASTMLVCHYGYSPAHDLDYCPDTLYGRSKVIGETALRSAACLPGSWVLVRPTSIWGPWCGPPYHDFFLRVVRGRYLQPGGKPIAKALGFVGNVVHQLFRIMNADTSAVDRRTFYLQDYGHTTIVDWARVIQRCSGAPPIRVGPMPLMRAFAYAGDLLKWTGVENPPLTTFRLRNMTTASGFDTTALHAIAGALPYDVEAGVRATLDWFAAMGRLPATGTSKVPRLAKLFSGEHTLER
jgi:nucleoside-diphosphate-sugar epimerase